MVKYYDDYGFEHNFEDNENSSLYMFGKIMHKNYATKDLDAILHDQPHYTEDYYKEAKVIFGEEESNCDINYSDRLWEWDYDKAEKSAKRANNSKAKQHTARWYQEYLSAYFDKKVIIKCIMAGHNWSNGYPYQVFFYKFK